MQENCLQQTSQKVRKKLTDKLSEETLLLLATISLPTTVKEE